jgi:glycosyltransferase involved in cell wall biosynthesis
MKKILFMLPHEWYVAAYIEYVVRYLGSEYDFDIAIPTEDFYPERDYPEKYGNPTICLTKNPENYDLLISLLTSHAHIDYKKNSHKLAQIIWERGERNQYALVHGSTTDETDREMKEANIPYSSIRMGVDENLFKPYPLYKEPGVMTVGIVGRLHSQRKRIKELVVPLYDMPGVKFNLYFSQRLQPKDIEDIGGKESYLRLKSGCKLWTGMPNIYNQIDLLVETDMGKSLDFTVLEASACGVPSIALRHGLDDLGNILIDDPAELREKIEFVRDNIQKRKYMGIEARNTVLNKYTWYDVIPQWKYFINKSLSLCQK